MFQCNEITGTQIINKFREYDKEELKTFLQFETFHKIHPDIEIKFPLNRIRIKNPFLKPFLLDNFHDRTCE